ncbi:MAG: DUF6384 family protein [Pseudomonadota bacterium]
MTDPISQDGNHSSTDDSPIGGQSKLNDIMIAMDVVDTLRHDRKLVDRELNDDVRRDDLIKRLREIYHGQGIEVPDHILEEGVKALEEDRFVYTPPPEGRVSTRLAKLYVTRWSWGRYAIGIAAGLIAFFLANYFFYERPRALEAEAVQRELTVTLPKELRSLASAVASEGADQAVGAKAQQVTKAGLNAAKSGELATARASRDELKTTLDQLRASYSIRIVNREGEVSGLWRIPQANPDAYNFYLVVEAIGSDGKVMPRSVLNEETGKRETVTTWAQRVDRQVLVDVKADKDDDGIIQNATVGQKARGQLEPTWTIPVAGGAITRWK